MEERLFFLICAFWLLMHGISTLASPRVQKAYDDEQRGFFGEELPQKPLSSYYVSGVVEIVVALAGAGWALYGLVSGEW